MTQVTEGLVAGCNSSVIAGDDEVQYASHLLTWEINRATALLAIFFLVE